MKFQKAVVKTGTILKVGKVVAIQNAQVLIDTGKQGVRSFTFEQVEKWVQA